VQKRLFIWIVTLALPLEASATDIVSLSGEQLYGRYCSACHGPAGRGDGPVSKSFREEVPDLTRFAQRHGNVFDRGLVERIIDGRYIVGAHGTRTMPVWGEDLSLAQIGNPDAEKAGRIIILRMADYVWQLQRPSTAASPGKPSSDAK